MGAKAGALQGQSFMNNLESAMEMGGGKKRGSGCEEMVYTCSEVDGGKSALFCAFLHPQAPPTP